ncbi:MAG: phosphohistidine phosphatase SixA [Geminicoccaceae bacterium]
MRLYLVQHGEAVPAAIDPERPLSPSGVEDVRRAAALLATAKVRVPRVLHSGKRRAAETAELLAAAVAPGTTPEACPGLDPGEPTDALARQAQGFEEDLMLVGHLPFMARLAARLITGGEDTWAASFVPGTVLCLERMDDGRWAVAWLLPPELFGPRH